MNSRVRLLLGLAAILAVMRFVVVPWIERDDTAPRETAFSFRRSLSVWRALRRDPVETR